MEPKQTLFKVLKSGISVLLEITQKKYVNVF